MIVDNQKELDSYSHCLMTNSVKCYKTGIGRGLYGLTDWQAHCIVIAAINGSVLGYRKKSKEAFEQLREHMEKMEEEE